MYLGEIKVLLLGNLGVGKTSLINIFAGKEFNSNSKFSSLYKKLDINNNFYNINLWDTMGEEAHKSLSKIIFRGAEIVIFVYDITSKQSFIDLEKWIQMTNDILDNNYIGGIVGNKNDLNIHSEVSEEEGKKYAEEKKMAFKLVSAKEEPPIFNNFLIELIKNIKIPEKESNIHLHRGFTDCKPCCISKALSLKN